MIQALDQKERRTVANRMREIARGTEFVQDVFRTDPIKILMEADRFEKCGLEFSIYQCQSDQVNFKIPCTCKSRICEKCAGKYTRALQSQIVKTIKGYMARKRKGWFVSLLTLTINSNRFQAGYPTPADIQKAGRQVSEFMRLYYGKYKGKRSKNNNIYSTRKFRGSGGLAVMELGANGNLHFHCVVYGPYIAQKILSEAWLRITEDSYIVDIRAVRGDSHDAARYVMKYLSKLPKTDSYTDLAMYALMIKGVRRLRTFGIMYASVKIIKKNKTDLRCLYCGGELKWRGVHSDCDPVLNWYQLHSRGDPIPKFRPYDVELDYVRASIGWVPEYN